ncbi:MYG1 family protein [Clostridium sp. SYSU_GA19001]|uniref:MYG1 family protein n=1 Tax=Clostridium caldaquaticum TaxID=2940653 RepID=UPI002076DC92|nr:MYG1 family protein [Clostridium caldaquaticum]MCM8709855.1 MYG1 family protein [Clostridium caldaquaticum]
MKKIFKKIGTHDGKFHADEVVATAILKELFNVEIIRIRDEKLLKDLDIVYDVGGGELDHHGINKTYRESGTPYAACGLIWKKFGLEVLRFMNPSLNSDEVEGVFNYIDKNFIEGIDALDNGIWIDRTEIPLMHISSIIENFNPAWNSDKDENKAFNEAVEIAAIVLRNMIENRFAVLDAKSHVEKAYKNRSVPEILVLNIHCPYADTLRELDERGEVLYVVYPRKDSYAMQSVRDENGDDKKKLPKAWAGLRDKELAEVTGVSDAVFCHTGRFIAVAGSYEGIMKLARLAVLES